MMKELEEKLGYAFHDPALLDEALNHSSYANEHRGRRIRLVSICPLHQRPAAARKRRRVLVL